jgi:hypothetical protein
MAYQVKTPAKGDAPNTGSPGPTPAPRAKAPAAPDSVSKLRAPSTGNGYGQNGFAGRSSINPGEQELSPLAANLKATVDDDGALDAVIARGAKMADSNFETRSESDVSYPPAHGMKHRTANDGSPGDKVPGSIGATDGPLPKNPFA